MRRIVRNERASIKLGLPTSPTRARLYEGAFRTMTVYIYIPSASHWTLSLLYIYTKFSTKEERKHIYIYNSKRELLDGLSGSWIKGPMFARDDDDDDGDYYLYKGYRMSFSREGVMCIYI